MLYLAIDQHRKQLTVNLRNESGDVLLKRQVSTDWLIEMLKEYGCGELILIQPEKRSKKRLFRRIRG